MATCGFLPRSSDQTATSYHTAENTVAVICWATCLPLREGVNGYPQLDSDVSDCPVIAPYYCKLDLYPTAR